MSFIELKNITKYFAGTSNPAVHSLNLGIDKGEIITLLGPSGCGKTTTLRMIAGFEHPTDGAIEIDGKQIFNKTHALPPEKRGIGMVFQDYALFPHMTILKNVMFGLNKWSVREKKQRAKEVLELVGLEDFANRYPTQLSGGQQQRVALARALAPKPHVVLMDEPFSNLDAGLREKMRFDVTNILRKANTTAIIVTHDQKDAFAVSDRVVVMKDGVIQQIAAPKEMYRCPKNCFVAQFVGKTNLLTGTMDDDQRHIHTHIGKVCLPDQWKEHVETVKLSIRPEGCQLAEQGAYCGVVERVTYGGEYQELYVRLHNQPELSSEPMLIYAPVEQDVEIGRIVSFDIKPELIALVE
ncbi:ABC transporter ATP-binding protein [Evansella cellulosilytica]|uniref:Carnitine transport ATP-binding protein OpuCA n=1 Tax=Evansella cellulosilytica (strain ATCC 21833 / DSM 2522 / FERM P-1141 / JCM 9156 / N-4) TaxID=649639 RepID=E6TV35_EVAC2|nr:ABC transporter ATP-binding protein [Evansella cellulosilytica]ADU28618.1 ABC transporter related protein [Evansella cellulosilytica DSM 2522]